MRCGQGLHRIAVYYREVVSMTNAMGMGQAITEWFETDFKEAAKATTKTQRLDDGRLAYSFSVTNNSGFDFSKFSFRIKVIDKDRNAELGTASIKAGAWAEGETKNFKSRLFIPDNVRSLSFVMYANSLDFEARPTDSFMESFKDMGELIQGMGDALTGADGSGGIFGELFGTGGMPEGGSAQQRQPARQAPAAAPKAAPKAAPQTPNPRYVPPKKTYTQRKTEKKLNKMRLGKSEWTVISLALGVICLIAVFGEMAETGGITPDVLESAAIAGIFLGAGGISKLVLSRRAKRIRTYEARVNQNGNTSIDDLAAAVGKPFEKVADDLQAMIADGFFGEAYIDIDNRMLVMTRDGRPIESVEKSAAENKKARRKAARSEGLVPESIDDLITMTDDAEIKSKLSSLRAITKKIDARVDEVPELEKQVEDFREKYYPEVVRLTDEYNEKIANMGRYGDEAERAEVGEDAAGAPVINTNPNYLAEQASDIKSELITLIDSVSEASENLLEKLHEDDIMDITTDIKKLQTTLASKGLLDSDFDL